MAAPVPDDVEALKAALASMRSERDDARAERDEAQAEVAVVKAERADDQALIAHLKLLIARYKREKFGVASERSSRLLDQMELQLEESHRVLVSRVVSTTPSSGLTATSMPPPPPLSL